MHGTQVFETFEVHFHYRFGIDLAVSLTHKQEFIPTLPRRSPWVNSNPDFLSEEKVVMVEC
jgi:hypothetical protein